MALARYFRYSGLESSTNEYTSVENHPVAKGADAGGRRNLKYFVPSLWFVCSIQSMQLYVQVSWNRILKACIPKLWYPNI